MFSRALFLVLLVALAGIGGTAFAADARPTVGPGASKDDVINAYGWPSGQSSSGTKEILSYPQGTVTLEGGRVEKVDFQPNVPWPAPRPRPGPPTASTAKKVEPPVDFWLTNFDEAAREARRRHARILALFTGTDWSPPSRQFHDEVEFHPDFVNAFTGDFVFLRLEFAARAPQPNELKEQNAQLRARYGVTVYPSLLVLSPGGTLVAQVDLAKPQSGDTYRDRVIAAVKEVRDALVAHPPAPEPADVEAAPAPDQAPAAVSPRGPGVIQRILESAGSVLALGIAAGLVLAVFGIWWLWRSRAQPNPQVRAANMTARISDAAAGVPREQELREWPRERLRSVTAGLAEAEGYEVVTLAGGADADLALRRLGETTPRVIVWCVAQAGHVHAKRVRELFGTMTAEGAPVGWLVAPAGFSSDAKAFAEEHDIVLIDSERLATMLRDLPPLILPKVLTRVG